MEFDTIDVSVDGPRGHIWLNRPDKLNPLSNHTLAEIHDAARWLDTRQDIKVVVVGGRGRAFTAGADVSVFRDADPGSVRQRSQGWRTARALEELHAVTIARIQGWCVGGGVVLAAACDLRVVAEDAIFSIPEVELGIPLAWGGIPRLVREVGPALTKELVMTCREFSAQEAKEAGFVNRVVPAEQLDEAVEELASRLDGMPRLALLATKAHVNAVTESMVHTGRSWADAHGLGEGLVDEEGRASAAAYLERHGLA